jgi:hypothetical protein
MHGSACGRWTLDEMFPPRYRVSNNEGYKKGSAWLRIKIVEENGLYRKERTRYRLNTVSKGMK